MGLKVMARKPPRKSNGVKVMATKAKKNEARDWDNFGSDDRAKNAKERGLRDITPPKKTATKPKKK